MTSRLVPMIVLALAVPLGASAQIAATAPAPAVAPVAAQPAVAPQPAIAPQPAQAPQPAEAPVATPTPRLRTERETARAQAVEARMEAMKQRRVQNEQERQSKGINVRIDATVIESKGDQVTGRKVLSLTLVDGGGWGSVRSSQQVQIHTSANTTSWRQAPLNMDARANLREDGKIKVDLTVEYRGGIGGDEGKADTIDEGIKQSVTVVLESGKPLVVAQSADAVGDRRVALEVKATVLK